jgi:hypothetical protein
MKRLRLSTTSLLLLSLLAASGCAYTLRYSVKTTHYGGGEAPHAAGSAVEAPSVEEQPRAFALEHMIRKGRYGYSTEKKLLDILSRSLEDLGWSLAPEAENASVPVYRFSVDFERPESSVNPGFGFGASTGGGGGFFFSTMVDIDGGDNLRILRINASPPGAVQPGEARSEAAGTGTSRTGASSKVEWRQYVWSAEIRSEASAANLIDLARHAMPKALERFPESGFWELREKVAPRRGASPPEPG